MADFMDRPLPEAARKHIKALIAHHSSLDAILHASRDLTPAESPKSLYGSIAEAVKLPRSEVDSVFMALSNLIVLVKEAGSISEVVSYIGESLSEGQSEEWSLYSKNISKAITGYTEDNPVAISIKANQLSYQHEKLLVRTEILTDARPVFDASGENVLEVIVTHTLAITYHTSRRTENIYLALDAEDVIKLKKACERAATKAKSLKTALTASGLSTKILNDIEGS